MENMIEEMSTLAVFNSSSWKALEELLTVGWFLLGITQVSIDDVVSIQRACIG